MTRTHILSHETVCQLLEAHASLAAWYYQLSDALRATGETAEPPSEQHRKAFLEQLAGLYPELAEVARGIEQPQPYLPPPALVMPAAAPSPSAAEEVAPAAAEADEATSVGGAETSSAQAVVPPVPPLVEPAAVAEAEGEQADQAAASQEPADAPRGDEAAATAEGAEPVAPPPLVDPDKVRYD